MIEYQDGKLIITHLSGHVDIYEVCNIEQFKTHIVKGIARLKLIEAELDNESLLIKAGLSVSPP